MKLRSHKALFGVFSVAASLLLLVSAAYACTTFRGTFTLTQNGVSKTNFGSDEGMTFCDGATGETMSLSRTGGDITASGGPSSGNCPSQLAERSDYNIRKEGTLGADCMNGTKIGDAFAIGSDGKFSRTLSQTDVSTTTKVLCIADQRAVNGMEMAVNVT